MSRSAVDLTTCLGEYTLSTPLVAACGTVGSVVDFAAVGHLEEYGAAVAKSVSGTPWPGRTPPRLAGTGAGMLNGIGIQNPGVEAWADEVGPQLGAIPTDIWGSAVGKDAAEFARVAEVLSSAGVTAIEVNLSCPNLESGRMFALDADASTEVIAAVRTATELPIGAKLTPNSERIVAIADAVVGAGADWVVLGNTVWGAGFDIHTRKPLLSGVVGGYSGKPIKPISLRCVWEVSQGLPHVPIVGLGGVSTAEDAIEYLIAGASAVGIGTAHFASPRVGSRILSGLRRYMRRQGMSSVRDLIGSVEPW
ncbi:MAG: dihydroorotate dehydrogenase [Acidimicrobiia bacterium]|nr:dihydroorotate dehydrogenase [Acidimicrobiia bacterium]